MTRADLRKLVDEVPDARVEGIAVVLRRVIDDPEVERLLGILREEREILKKAASFFATDTRPRR